MQEDNIKIGTLRVMKAAFMAGSSFAKVHQKTFGTLPNNVQSEAGWNMFLNDTLKTILKNEK